MQDTNTKQNAAWHKTVNWKAIDYKNTRNKDILIKLGQEVNAANQALMTAKRKEYAPETVAARAPHEITVPISIRTIINPDGSFVKIPLRNEKGEVMKNGNGKTIMRPFLPPQMMETATCLTPSEMTPEQIREAVSAVNAKFTSGEITVAEFSRQISKIENDSKKGKVMERKSIMEVHESLGEDEDIEIIFNVNQVVQFLDSKKNEVLASVRCFSDFFENGSEDEAPQEDDTDTEEE